MSQYVYCDCDIIIKIKSKDDIAHINSCYDKAIRQFYKTYENDLHPHDEKRALAPLSLDAFNNYNGEPIYEFSVIFEANKDCTFCPGEAGSWDYPGSPAYFEDAFENEAQIKDVIVNYFVSLLNEELKEFNLEVDSCDICDLVYDTPEEMIEEMVENRY